MLIAVAGSQGSGKGTILAGMAERGFKTIERKTSRSILDEWGVTLDQVNNDPELTMQFQSRISDRKLEDEREALESDEIYLTERTHADLFTYALVTLGKLNTYSTWIDLYYQTCAEHTRRYHHIIWVPGGMFPVKHDGVRGSNQHYSRMVDVTMLDVTDRMVGPDRITQITTAGIDARVEETLQIIKDNT
jgi:predicted ATPase